MPIIGNTMTMRFAMSPMYIRSATSRATPVNSNRGSEGIRSLCMDVFRHNMCLSAARRFGHSVRSLMCAGKRMGDSCMNRAVAGRMDMDNCEGGPNGVRMPENESPDVMSPQYRQAISRDAEGILRIIAEHDRYENVLSSRASMSEEGFLLAKLTVPEIDAILKTEPAVYVATHEKQVVGFIIGTRARSNLYEDLKGCSINWTDGDVEEIYNDRKHLYLWLIGVQARYQRRGIASGLLETLHARAAALGYEAVITDVMASPVDNQASVDLFNAHGYIKSGLLRISDYFGSGSSVWQIFSKKLDHI